MHRVTRMGLVNAWLVEEDDGLTLIDTLLPRTSKLVLGKARKLGRPIVRIALTHGHGDHVGGLDGLVSRLPGVEVLIPARDQRVLAGDKTTDAGEPEAPMRGSWPTIKTQPTRTLVPGDTVGSLQVVAAPGHTPGQVAFFDPRDRTLYCGDAYSTLGGVATSARPNPAFPLPALATWHRPTALRTAKDLRALDPAVLAPGHGKAVTDPGAKMDAAIAKAG